MKAMAGLPDHSNAASVVSSGPHVRSPAIHVLPSASYPGCRLYGFHGTFTLCRIKRTRNPEAMTKPSRAHAFFRILVTPIKVNCKR